MTYEHILVDAEDGVGIVTLNRPDKLNAMNRKLGSELQHAVKALEADDGSAASSSPARAARFRPAATSTSSARTTASYSQEELDRMRTDAPHL